MKIDLHITCCLCGESYDTEINLPDGWDHRYGGIDSEVGFCAKHASVADWADSQCPGCVGSWMDCALWRGFTYSHQRDLTNDELNVIRTGTCPRRTNGMFGFSRSGGMQKIDLSEPAITHGGEAFAQAILDYWEKYGD